jgi:hypothetical protein
MHKKMTVPEQDLRGQTIMDRLDPDPQRWSDNRINYQSNSLIIKFLYLYYHSKSRTTARAGRQQEQGDGKSRAKARKG